MTPSDFNSYDEYLSYIGKVADDVARKKFKKSTRQYNGPFKWTVSGIFKSLMNIFKK